HCARVLIREDHDNGDSSNLPCGASCGQASYAEVCLELALMSQERCIRPLQDDVLDIEPSELTLERRMPRLSAGVLLVLTFAAAAMLAVLTITAFLHEIPRLS